MIEIFKSETDKASVFRFQRHHIRHRPHCGKVGVKRGGFKSRHSLNKLENDARSAKVCKGITQLGIYADAFWQNFGRLVMVGNKNVRPRFFNHVFYCIRFRYAAIDSNQQVIVNGAKLFQNRLEMQTVSFFSRGNQNVRINSVVV